MTGMGVGWDLERKEDRPKKKEMGLWERQKTCIHIQDHRKGKNTFWC